jgi:type IV pilus assembly protein PilA
MNRKFSIFGKRDIRQGKRQNGFTLMELLIVISIIVILMLIAIPTSRTIKKKANELSAQKSLQTIEQGESMYETTYPVNGFACTLPALAGDPASGPPSPAHRLSTVNWRLA